MIEQKKASQILTAILLGAIVLSLSIMVLGASAGAAYRLFILTSGL